MEEQKTNNEEKQKLTYEQLNDACNQLWQQNQQLIKRNRELEQYSMFKRLDYLFKVVKYNNMFNSEFIANCVNEIEEAITVKAEEEEA